MDQSGGKFWNVVISGFSIIVSLLANSYSLKSTSANVEGYTTSCVGSALSRTYFLASPNKLEMSLSESKDY